MKWEILGSFWECDKIVSYKSRHFNKEGYFNPFLSYLNNSDPGFPYLPISYENLIKDSDDSYSELIKEDEYDKAIEKCDEALKINSKDIIALINKAIIYSLNSKYTEADKILDKALKASKDDIHKSIICYNKGQILNKNKKYLDAINALEYSLRYDPDNCFIEYEIQYFSKNSLHHLKHSTYVLAFSLFLIHTSTSNRNISNLNKSSLTTGDPLFRGVKCFF